MEFINGDIHLHTNATLVPTSSSSSSAAVPSCSPSTKAATVGSP